MADMSVRQVHVSTGCEHFYKRRERGKILEDTASDRKAKIIRKY